MVKHLEKEGDFKELVNDKILIDFYADWCGPCKMLAPILEEIDFIDVLKINVDQFPELSAKFGVMSIPTFKCFKNGTETGTTVGVQGKGDLIRIIKL